MLNNNIPINKGNYAMETPEREELFEIYKGEDWPEGYKNYRDNWVKYAKNQFVSEYPLLVDLELASVCNLKCPMCYTITKEFKKKVNAKLMDFELFTKVIDEIAGKVPAIRLSLRGEAILHPKFIDAIKYAKSKGINEVSTLTNGSKLNEKYFTEMMNSGIDWITFSIDGLDETYNKIRKPITFEKIFGIVKKIKEIKDKHGKHKPVIKIQSIWPAIRENHEEYYNKFVEYVDLIAYNPLIDYLGNDSFDKILYEENFSCPQPYQRVVVGADGLVMMCSNDEENSEVMGNAETQTIYEIWHGEKLNRIREIHKKKNGFVEIGACKKCYIPRLTDENEKASVNGREFTVKNYINRAQGIGE